MRIILLSLVAATLFSQTPDAGQAPAPPAMPTIAVKTAGMRAAGGFLPFHWDSKAGKIWLELSRFGTEMLYVVSLPAGVGSNDIGLDRGQIRGEKIVRFERSGPKVLLVEPNYAFRANSESVDERRSVEEAFAQSVLWGFEVGAEEGDRVLVDATAFFLRDAHGVAERLRTTQQGTWRTDPSRSALYEPRTRSFPKNTEVEAIPEEHRGGSHRYVDRRERRTVPPFRCTISRHHHGSTEAFVHRTAGRLHAAAV